MTYITSHATFQRGRKLNFLCDLLLVVAVFGGLLTPASASEFGRRDVVDFVEKNVRQFADSVNSASYRTSVGEFTVPSHCESPVEMTLSDPERPVGRFTVTLECEHPRYWKTRVKAESEVMVDMVVAKKPLKRGQHIQRTDLGKKAVNIAYVRYGYFGDIPRLVGKVVRRNIAPGRVLTPRMVDMPEWVKRDDIVIIEARRDNMVARMKGLALESGAEGDVIRVENMTSGKEIVATISAPGTVTTTF